MAYRGEVEVRWSHRHPHIPSPLHPAIHPAIHPLPKRTITNLLRHTSSLPFAPLQRLQETPHRLIPPLILPAQRLTPHLSILSLDLREESLVQPLLLANATTTFATILNRTVLISEGIKQVLARCRDMPCLGMVATAAGWRARLNGSSWRESTMGGLGAKDGNSVVSRPEYGS